MSTDRIIKWKAEKPSRDEVGQVLHDFFNGAHEGIKWDRDRFFVRLPGVRSGACERLAAADEPSLGSEVELEFVGLADTNRG